MNEPQRIKLTNNPIIKNVKPTPLPSKKVQYPETMIDDLYVKNLETNLLDTDENNTEDNP